jgi:RNA polymerase sigma-70 factor (ECF subfamily)
LLRSTTVEDLYQDTVAAAVGSVHKFTFYDDTRFLRWVNTIAKRVIARSSARAGREPQAVRVKRAGSSGVGVPDCELYASIRTPSSIVSRRERERALVDAINALPDHYRQALTLYKLEERPLADVAQRMGRTVGATAQLIRRATRELQARLETDG